MRQIVALGSKDLLSQMLDKSATNLAVEGG